MADKTKPRKDTKKILEKLMADVSSGKNLADKKEEKKVETKKTDEKKEAKVDKTEERKHSLEEVAFENNIQSKENVDLGRVVLLNENNTLVSNPIERPSFRDAPEEKKVEKVEERKYNENKLLYQDNDGRERRETQQPTRIMEIPSENLHLMERSGIMQGPAPLKQVGMVHNPELENQHKTGYEPYQTARLDTTQKKPWEGREEDRVKKYR